jgi:hypothetical protein
MQHIRPGWFHQFADKHPRIVDLLPILGITVCLCAGIALLLWLATARIKGLG